MFKSILCITTLFFGKSSSSLSSSLLSSTTSVCAPGCNNNLIGDSHCDSYCNNIYCNFDGGDCNPNLRGDFPPIMNAQDINDINDINDMYDIYYNDFYNKDKKNDKKNDKNIDANIDANIDTDNTQNTLSLSNTFNSGSCNLTDCPNIFFDDCNSLQKHTSKWCNYDNDDHENDFCCAKYHTDCCEYDV